MFNARTSSTPISGCQLVGEAQKLQTFDFHRGFQDVDHADEQSFIQFLDLTDQVPSIVKCRERMLERCPVTAQSIVLDVGCGVGAETTRLARRAGRRARVHGVDASEAMIREARRRAKDLHLSLDFEVSDAQSLPFDDSSFDLCRAERVLLYVENPARAISEMARVTRPGGRVVVFDFDFDTRFIDSDFAVMTRQIEDLLGRDPRHPAIGRELPHLMRGAGLRVDAIEPVTLMTTLAIARRVYADAIAKGISQGLFTASDAEAWWREQDAREQAGTLYHAQHGYIVAASKL